MYVGEWIDRYVHDAQIVTYDSGPYAGKEIAFCCAGLNGGGTQTGLSILDVTNKAVIIAMAPLIYTGGFPEWEKAGYPVARDERAATGM